MKVTVCIGSSCHVKGSHQVVEKLKNLIEENGLDSKVQLGGTFCMGRCQQGVSVSIDDEFYSFGNSILIDDQYILEFSFEMPNKETTIAFKVHGGL